MTSEKQKVRTDRSLQEEERVNSEVRKIIGEEVMKFFTRKRMLNKKKDMGYDSEEERMKNLEKAKELRETKQINSDFYYKLQELIDRIHVFQDKFLSRQPKFLQKLKNFDLNYNRKKEKIVVERDEETPRENRNDKKGETSQKKKKKTRFRSKEMAMLMNFTRQFQLKEEAKREKVFLNKSLEFNKSNHKGPHLGNVKNSIEKTSSLPRVNKSNRESQIKHTVEDLKRHTHTNVPSKRFDSQKRIFTPDDAQNSLTVKSMTPEKIKFESSDHKINYSRGSQIVMIVRDRNLNKTMDRMDYNKNLKVKNEENLKKILSRNSQREDNHLPEIKEKPQLSHTMTRNMNKTSLIYDNTKLDQLCSNCFVKLGSKDQQRIYNFNSKDLDLQRVKANSLGPIPDSPPQEYESLSQLQERQKNHVNRLKNIYMQPSPMKQMQNQKAKAQALQAQNQLTSGV